MSFSIKFSKTHLGQERPPVARPMTIPLPWETGSRPYPGEQRPILFLKTHEKCEVAEAKFLIDTTCLPSLFKPVARWRPRVAGRL